MLTVFLSLAMSLQSPAWELSAVAVRGTQRFGGDAVASAAGLQPGGRASRAEMDAACQKLVESGLFRSCNYKYIPVSDRAVRVELQVREAPADHDARITVPNVDEDKIWAWLASNEPLVGRRLPGSDESTRFYVAAIQRGLREMGHVTELTSSVDSDLSGKMTVVFRPANLTVITDVRFKGNALFTEKRLRDVLMVVTANAPYTDIDFRRMLDLNIRPLYEQAGRLGMTYSKVTVEPADRGVVVTTALSEGPVYVLKNALVTVDGAAPDAVLRVAQLPIGKIANWRAVQDGLEAATDTLKSEGYLEARYEVERTLDDQAGTAVAKVAFQRGPQFTFGALQIEGVPADLELRVRELWRLPSGAPANETYVNQFLRTAFQVLGRDYRSVSKEIEVRPGTRVVDVTARFAR